MLRIAFTLLFLGISAAPASAGPSVFQYLCGGSQALDRPWICLEMVGAAVLGSDDDPAEALERGKVLLEEKTYDTALAVFEQILWQHPRNVDALVGRARALEETYDRGAAMADIHKALSIEPNHRLAIYSHGMLLGRSREYQKALDAFTRVIDLPGEAKRPEAYRNRGVAYRKLGDNDAALENYAEALRLAPNDVRTLEMRAFLHTEVGNIKAALADRNRLVRLDDDLVEALEDRANLLEQLGRPVAAATDYSVLIGLEPSSTQRLLQRAYAFHDAKRYHEAISDFDRVIVMAPRLASAYSGRGIMLERLGKEWQALANYEIGLAIDPEDRFVHVIVGAIWEKKRRLQRALAAYDKAIEVAPDYADAWLSRGELNWKLAKFERAKTDLQMAAELDPGSARAQSRLGELLHRLGKFADAKIAFSRAIDIDPSDFVNYENRALAMTKLGEIDGAVRDLIKALALEAPAPSRGRLHLKRARIHCQQDQYDLAFSDLRQSARLNDEIAGNLIAELRWSGYYDGPNTTWVTPPIAVAMRDWIENGCPFSSADPTRGG